jgi:hypothetical protein
MAIGTLPKISSASGGINTIADLYSLINGTEVRSSGQTVTDTGGRTTTTESSGISQEGMNAMLKQILEGSSGLAAVASGQRSAGGYSSSTNTLLTNDLLTRSAAQVASNNKTTTKTVDTPNTTRTISGDKKTTGGLTSSGIIKTIGSLATTKYGKKAMDVFNSNSVVEAASSQSTGDFARLDGESYRSAPTESTTEANVDYSNINGFDSPNYTANITDTFNTTDTSGIDYSAYPEPAPYDDSAVDFNELFEFASGGLVKKKASLLTPSQYGSVNTSNNNSSVAGIVGEAFRSQATSVPATLTVNQTADNLLIQDNGGDSSPSGTPGSTNGGAAIGGVSLGSIGTGMSVAGAALGNSTLGGIGAIGSIAGSSNPAATMAGMVANSITGGLSGAIGSLAANPSISNTIDVALALSSPPLGMVNAVLGAINAPTIGTVATNLGNAVNPNSPVSLSMAFSNMAAPVQAAHDHAVAAEDSNPNGSPNNNAQASVANEAAVNSPNAPNMSEQQIDQLALDTLIDIINMDPTSTNSSNSSGASNSSSAAEGGGVSGAGNSAGTGTDGTTEAAFGGKINGPGTGTSDSIDAKLSDGETVITAKTTAKVRELFGADFFNNLESMFNAPAAEKQKQLGRV